LLIADLGLLIFRFGAEARVWIGDELVLEELQLLPGGSEGCGGVL